MRALALLMLALGCAATATGRQGAAVLPREDVQGTWTHVEPAAPSVGGAVTLGDGFVTLWSGCDVAIVDETATSGRMVFTQCADEAGAPFTIHTGTVALERGMVLLFVDGEDSTHTRHVLRFEEM